MNEFEDDSRGEADEDLWLVSYADLLTLLLAFFVLMLSMSVLQHTPLQNLASALRGDPESPTQKLRKDIQAVIGKAGAQVIAKEDAAGVGIQFANGLLFPSGGAELRGEGKEIVEQVAAVIRALPNAKVTIQGHSDDLPIHNGQFRSNWELSASRAIRVLEALEGAGVPHEWMSVQSFADTQPVEAQSVEERRAASRRVVIRVE